MLKHVEQSVALAALRWFRDNEAGLAATYAPHAELDVQFRGRLKLLRENAAEIESSVSHDDPDLWPIDVVLGAFTATVMLKDAMDAAGPRLLRRTHEMIGRAGVAAGLPILDPRAVEAERRRRAKGPRARYTRRRTDAKKKKRRR